MKPAGKVRERNDDMAGYIEAPSRRVESAAATWRLLSALCFSTDNFWVAKPEQVSIPLGMSAEEALRYGTVGFTRRSRTASA